MVALAGLAAAPVFAHGRMRLETIYAALAGATAVP